MKSAVFAKIAGILTLFCLATAVAASPQTLTTLVNFNGTDGSSPTVGSPLVQGTDGNFYGVTYFGGTPTTCFYSVGTGCGTVFKMTPAGEITSLYSFCSQANCSDGADPLGLIQASDGNFYGVTAFDGQPPNTSECCGTIFKITPSGTLTTLYRFCSQQGCSDGSEPTALIEGADGNFYGVTFRDGAHGSGTVFKFHPAGKLTTLHSFCVTSGCPDGSGPGNLIQASNKNFYGSTTNTIFEITPAGKLSTLNTFKHGASNTLIQANGNFYGTTDAGGSGDHGIVFEMTPAGKLTSLHQFCPLNCATGDSPLSGLAQGSDGNFYGTTYLGGNTYYAGSVYEITPTGTYTILYQFCSQTNCTDGDAAGAIMQATNGDFYGITASGGTGPGAGTVYSLSTGLGPFVAARPGFGSASQVVTILGNNLTGTTSVTFNGTAAKFKVGSDTYIQAQVPTGATSGTIQVTTPSGTLNSNVAFQVVP